MLTLAPLAGLDALVEEATSNEEKSAMLVKLMFPACPDNCSVPSDFSYPERLPTPKGITMEQVQHNIARLSPYKAPGPDRIPNIVLKACADMVVPYLVPIYRAVLKLKIYPCGWRELTTCILCKPGKP